MRNQLPVDRIKPMIRIPKVHEAVIAMMKEVDYNDDGHVYTRVSDGKFLAGVSTISSIFPKPWLSAWGAKEVAKYLGFSDYKEECLENSTKMLERIKGLEVKDYQKLIVEAKGAASRKSKDALIDGTLGHEILESIVKYRMGKGSLDKYYLLKEGEPLKRAIDMFLEWETKNVEKWVLSEARVADAETYEFAGTLDAMAILRDGRLAIIDFKFASHIGEDYYLQTAGYQLTFELKGIKVDTRIILRFPKTDTMDVYDKVTRSYSKVENTIEAREVPTPYEFDRDTFIAARQIARYINFIQK